MSVWESYVVLERLAPGIVRILRSSRGEGHTAVWAAVKSRKACKDAVTGFPLPAGSRVYRPVGNQMYRAERIQAHAVDSTEPGQEIA